MPQNKRKRRAPALEGGSTQASAGEQAETKAGLTAYERQREELIARNRARLLALGIPQALSGLQGVVQAAAPPKPKRQKRVPKPPAAPSRHSARLKQEDDTVNLDDPATQLAMFVIDGECPRCGKVFQKGHKVHLEKCTGTRHLQAHEDVDEEEEEVDELTEQEIADEKEDQKRRQKTKLRELELSGLVEFNKEHAKFVVLGSTGKHYTVTLGGSPRCQCMDFRIRRRQCKHITLVLEALNISDCPGHWHKAVADQMDTLLSRG